MKTTRASIRRTAVAAAVVLATTATLLVGSPATQARPWGDDGLGVAFNTNPIIVSPPTGANQFQRISAYPGTATTWGIDGPITDVNVNLNGVQQGFPTDLDILLVSPSGTAVMLVSDACGTEQVSNATWVIDDEAERQLPDVPAIDGSCGGLNAWKPTDWEQGPAEEMPAPAPAPTEFYPWYGRTLSAFNGENPNGTWQLFIHDDRPLPANPADTGGLLSGFSVVVETETRQIVIPGQADGEGPATKYPYVIPVSGQVGRIRDVFVYLHNISHTRPDDLDVLLVAPGGQKIMLVSDSCGHFPTPNTRTWRINDRDPSMSDNGNCNLGGAGGAGNNFAPTDHEPGDVLPAPAPPGPYSTSLSTSLFNTDPNGEWKVFIHDDFTGHSGYVRDVQLSFELGPPVDVESPPDTSLTMRPDARTGARRAIFGFTASENGSTFECQLDGGAWSDCRSPETYRRLSFGRHTFGVRATDAAGNVDPTPATWSWRIRR
ncbi:MAG TPA: hypothetical protein VD859_04180 [Nocardioides sp.]|nr:hypothetical protein [Nocardioides sp.]